MFYYPPTIDSGGGLVTTAIASAEDFLSPVLWDSTNSEEYAPLKHDEDSEILVGDVRGGTVLYISFRNPAASTGNVDLEITTTDRVTSAVTTTTYTLAITASQIAIDVAIPISAAVSGLSTLKISRDWGETGPLANWLHVLTAGVA